MTLSAQLTPERYITRAASVLPQTATVVFFNVTGIVEITGLFLVVVNVAIQAQANALKGVFTPTGGSVGDISGTVDVNGSAIGSYVVFQGPTGAGAPSQSPTLVKTTGATGKTLALGGGTLVLKDGALGINCAASNTGQIMAILLYRSVAGGKVAAA